MLGGFRILNDRHAAMTLDPPQPSASIVEGTSQYHADHPWTVEHRSRAEQRIDRGTMLVLLRTVPQVDSPIVHYDVGVRRCNINAAWLNRLCAANFHCLQGAATVQNLWQVRLTT